MKSSDSRSHKHNSQLTNLVMDSHGQSLIQTLISVAIMGILVMATISMFSYQNKEMIALKESLASTDFQQQLTRAFKDGTICSQLLLNKTFDSTNAVAGASNHPSIALNISSIPVSTNKGAPALAAADAPLSSISNSLVAANPKQAFSVANIVGSHTKTKPGKGTYIADFQVNLNVAKMVRALRPISTQIELQTSGVGPTQTITSCQGANSGPGGYPQFFLSIALDDCGWAHPYLGCPAGFSAIGGTWHPGSGVCDALPRAAGYDNGSISSGWVVICIAQ